MTEKNRDIMDVSGDTHAEKRPAGSAERPVNDGKGGFFLNKFLGSDEEDSQTSAAEPAAENATDLATGPEADALKEAIVEALREIYDPEIPVNIYEMGLIYEVDILTDNRARVIMTLTTPHCPVAETMPGEVELKVASVEGVAGCEVKLVWDPPWDMSRMSDEARLELGML